MSRGEPRRLPVMQIAPATENKTNAERFGVETASDNPVTARHGATKEDPGRRGAKPRCPKSRWRRVNKHGSVALPNASGNEAVNDPRPASLLIFDGKEKKTSETQLGLANPLMRLAPTKESSLHATFHAVGVRTRTRSLFTPTEHTAPFRSRRVSTVW